MNLANAYSQARYYHLVLTTCYENTRWSAIVTDPFGLGCHNMNDDVCEADAIRNAISAAHGYLVSTHPEMEWPVLGKERVKWEPVQSGAHK